MKRKVPKRPIVMGKIGSTYGTRGWIRVFSSTEIPESIFNYQPWLIQTKSGQRQLINTEHWKPHSKYLIAKIKGVDDKNAAHFLTHCEIIIDSDKLPLLEEDNYYWKDLLGSQVVTIIGYKLGEVIDIMETGSNDVIVVRSNLKDAFGIKERLIPFILGQVITGIDLTARAITVNWDPSF